MVYLLLMSHKLIMSAVIGSSKPISGICRLFLWAFWNHVGGPWPSWIFTDRLVPFPKLAQMFGDLKPSTNSKDLAWPVTGRKSLALKNKCMNQHLSYNQGENLPQSKKYTNEGLWCILRIHLFIMISKTGMMCTYHVYCWLILWWWLIFY